MKLGEFPDEFISCRAYLMDRTSQAGRGQHFPGAGDDRAFVAFLNILLRLPLRVVIKQRNDFFHVFEGRSVVFQIGLGVSLEDTRIAANRNHLLYFKGDWVHHGSAQESSAARRVADKERFLNTEQFQKSSDMSDS